MKHQVENQLPARKLSMQIIIVIFALVFAIGLFVPITQASDKKSEKALQRHLEDSRQIIGKAKEKAQSGIPVIDDISNFWHLCMNPHFPHSGGFAEAKAKGARGDLLISK